MLEKFLFLKKQDKWVSDHFLICYVSVVVSDKNSIRGLKIRLSKFATDVGSRICQNSGVSSGGRLQKIQPCHRQNIRLSNGG